MWQAAVDFIDLEDSEHFYHAGDPYPRQGMKPTKKRVRVLSTNENRMGYPLIVEVVKEN